MEDTPLPDPESEQLAVILGSGRLRLVYGLLHRRRTNPPTANEIGFFLQTAAATDESVASLLRDLRNYFDIASLGTGGDERFKLQGWAGVRDPRAPMPISARRRAQALAPAKCAQCGRSPSKHDVVLEVDLRVPADWGGTNDPENLQPLCEACFQGKREFQQTYSAHAEQIRQAANYDEPQRRIGELLKAFGSEWVASDLIQIVASAKEYQDDFHRRIRDLRFLGWRYEQQNRYHEGARVKSYYRLIQSAPWPENIAAAIATEAKRRRDSKRRMR